MFQIGKLMLVAVVALAVLCPAPARAELPKDVKAGLEKATKSASKAKGAVKAALKKFVKAAKKAKKDSKGNAALARDDLGQAFAEFLQETDATVEETANLLADAVTFVAGLFSMDGIPLCERTGAGGIAESKLKPLQAAAEKAICKAAKAARKAADAIDGNDGGATGISVFATSGNHQVVPNDESATGGGDAIRPGIHLIFGNKDCLRIAGIVKVGQQVTTDDGSLAPVAEADLSLNQGSGPGGTSIGIPLARGSSGVTDPTADGRNIEEGDVEITTTETIGEEDGIKYIRFVVKVTKQGLAGFAPGDIVATVEDGTADPDDIAGIGLVDQKKSTLQSGGGAGQ